MRPQPQGRPLRPPFSFALDPVRASLVFMRRHATAGRLALATRIVEFSSGRVHDHGRHRWVKVLGFLSAFACIALIGGTMSEGMVKLTRPDGHTRVVSFDEYSALPPEDLAVAKAELLDPGRAKRNLEAMLVEEAQALRRMRQYRIAVEPTDGARDDRPPRIHDLPETWTARGWIEGVFYQVEADDPLTAVKAIIYNAKEEADGL